MELARCKNCPHRVDKASKKHYSSKHGLADKCEKCACNKPEMRYKPGHQASEVVEKYYPSIMSGKM